MGVVGLLVTAPTLRRGTDILLADDDTWWTKTVDAQDAEYSDRRTGSVQCPHLLLDRLQSVVRGSQAVSVWRKSGSGVGFDEREGSLVLLSGHLQQELKRQSNGQQPRTQTDVPAVDIPGFITSLGGGDVKDWSIRH